MMVWYHNGNTNGNDNDSDNDNDNKKPNEELSDVRGRIAGSSSLTCDILEGLRSDHSLG